MRQLTELAHEQSRSSGLYIMIMKGLELIYISSADVVSHTIHRTGCSVNRLRLRLKSSH